MCRYFQWGDEMPFIDESQRLSPLYYPEEKKVSEEGITSYTSRAKLQEQFARSESPKVALITSTDSCPSTNQHALRGVPTTICCPVRGFPPPDVTWTLPDGTVQKTGNTILPITPKTNDFGKYTCIAEGLKKTDPDPVIVSIILREERLNIVEIAANNNTQLKKGDKFKWTKVEGAQNYICRVYGADIDSKTFLAAEISIEIPYSELTFKAPNKIPDPVKVSIRVLAIDEDNVIGRGGPFAAEPNVNVHGQLVIQKMSRMTPLNQLEPGWNESEDDIDYVTYVV
ncbi:uncharacterized protein LOC144662837 [Oculina patagonica]